QAYQALRVANRQRAQDQAVHQGEDGGVRPDSEGEGRDRDESEGRTPAKDANAVTQVLREVVEIAGAAGVPAVLLGPVDAAELEEGAATRLRLGHSGLDVVRDLTLEVVAQLAVELLLQP